MFQLCQTLKAFLLQIDHLRPLTRLRRLQLCTFRLDSNPGNHTGTPNFQSLSLKLSSSSNDAQSDNVALRVQNLLKLSSNSSDEELYRKFDGFGLSLYLNEDTVVDVLSRHRSDWKPAYRFFNWVSRGSHPSGYTPGSNAYNEILGILGKMKRFDELHQLFDEMSEREGILNERTYQIVVHRYAAAHNTEAAINMFYKRRDYGLELDFVSFESLLLSLCRYKHVEEAEFLFHSKKGEFQYDIKTWNIVLNGWCVRGNLREAKRFWKEIIRSNCKPDKFTYGTFINCLCKSGKISTARKLLLTMWDKNCAPDVVICNTVIDGLCFKKRIPIAFEIIRVMNERNCPPDVVTYNSVIKHLCRIRRMEKVYELLDQMEEKKGNCSPNVMTFTYLLKSVRSKEEIHGILSKMEVNGCKMSGDIYNLLLRLYLKWGCEESVELTWENMERDGLGPDQRSYTVMVHGLYEQGRVEEGMRWFEEMVSKGMVPEPRTKLLVDDMNVDLKGCETESTSKSKVLMLGKLGFSRFVGLRWANGTTNFTS